MAENIALTFPHVTLSTSQPSRVHLQLSFKKEVIKSSISPSATDDITSMTHSWTFPGTTLKTTLKDMEKDILRLEVWRKWNWPWSETMVAEAEIPLVKLLKNHCSLPLSDPRRASQAVSIEMQATSEELKSTVHLFPETTSPAHWRQLFDHHSSRLNALKDIIYLLERGKIKETAKDDKWSFYLDPQTLTSLVLLLRRWALGELPKTNSNSKYNKKGAPSNYFSDDNDSDSSSDSSESSEGDLDLDLALAPQLSTDSSQAHSHLLSNLTVQLWNLIASIDLMRSKLGPLGLPLLILDILPAANAHHPRYALYLLEILRPYLIATNSVTSILIKPYCELITDTTKLCTSSLSSTSSGQASPLISSSSSSLSASYTNTVSMTPSNDDKSVTSDSHSLGEVTPSSSLDLSSAAFTDIETTDPTEIPRIDPIDSSLEIELNAVELAEVNSTYVTPPRRSTPVKAAKKDHTPGSLTETERKRAARMQRRVTKAQLKETKSKIREVAVREQGLIRFLTVLLQEFKYFDPGYIHAILKTNILEAVNILLSSYEVPPQLADLAIDTIKFIGPKFSAILEERGCLHSTVLLSQHSSDMALRMKAVESLSFFRPLDKDSNDNILLDVFISSVIQQFASSTTASTGNMNASPSIPKGKSAPLVNKFLQFLDTASPSSKAKAMSYPETVSMLLSYALSDSEAAKRTALSILPTTLPPQTVLCSIFPQCWINWIRNNTSLTTPPYAVRELLFCYWKLIMGASIHAPAYPWASDKLEDSSSATFESSHTRNTEILSKKSDTSPLLGHPPLSGAISSWLDWSIAEPILIGGGHGLLPNTLSFVEKNISTQGHQATNSTVLFGICQATRPLLDALVFECNILKRLMPLVFIPHGRDDELQRLISDFVSLLGRTHAIGLWVLAGSERALPFTTVSAEERNYKPLETIVGVSGPLIFDMDFLENLFQRVIDFHKSYKIHARKLMDTTSFWHSIGTLAQAAADSYQGFGTVPFLTFIEHFGHEGLISHFNFYKYLMTPVMQLLQKTDAPLSLLGGLSKGLCIGAQAQGWKHIRSSFSEDILAKDHPLYESYEEYFRRPRQMILLEKDGDPAWGPSEIPTGSKVKPLSTASISSSSSPLASSSKSNRTSMFMKKSRISVTPAAFSKKSLFDDDYDDDTVSDSSANQQVDPEGSLGATIEIPGKVDFPLTKIAELGALLLKFFDLWSIQIQSRLYPSVCLPLLRSLALADDFFADRLIVHQGFFKLLQPLTLSTLSSRSLAGLLLDNLRHPILNDQVCSNLIFPCFWQIFQTSLSDRNIAPKAAYHLLTRWLNEPSCRSTIASSMDSLVQKTLELSTKPEIVNSFGELWMSVIKPLTLDMSIQATFTTLGFLKTGVSGFLDAEIHAIYLEKVEQELSSHRQAGTAVYVSTASFFNKVQGINNFTSESLKLWMLLWRTPTGLSQVAAVFNPDLRSLSEVERILDHEHLERFREESDFTKNPSSSFKFMRPSPEERGLREKRSITDFEFGSFKNDSLVHEYRARCYRQAEFIANIFHEGVNDVSSHRPNVNEAMKPQSWPLKDPLLRLLAGAFRGWDKSSADYIEYCNMNKSYGTMIVKEVAQQVPMIATRYPLIILAILQVGVANSHLKFEYQLYPALNAIFEERFPERERSAAIVRDMAKVGARHPSELCSAIPVVQIIKRCLTSESPKLEIAGLRLLTTVASQNVVMNAMRVQGDFRDLIVQRCLIPHATNSRNVNHTRALASLIPFHKEFVTLVSKQDLINLHASFHTTFGTQQALSHLSSSLTAMWLEADGIYEDLMTPVCFTAIKSSFELLPRVHSRLLPFIIHNSPELIGLLLDNACGVDPGGFVNNGALVGRIALLLSNFSPEMRRGFLMRLDQLQLENNSNFLSRLIESSAQWQQFHKLAGVIDMMTALLNFQEDATDILGEKEWDRLINMLLVELGRFTTYSPVIKHVGELLAPNSSSKFNQNKPLMEAKKPMIFSAFSGGVSNCQPLFCDDNTVSVSVHDRPVYIVVEQKLSYMDAQEKLRTQYTLKGVVEPQVQMPPIYRVGFATRSALDFLKLNPHLSLGQVPGSYSVEHMISTIYANGSIIVCDKTRSLGTRKNFSATLDFEMQSIIVTFTSPPSDRDPPYLIWSVDLTEPLLPVLCFETGGTVSLDFSWTDEPFQPFSSKLWAIQNSPPQFKAPPFYPVRETRIREFDIIVERMEPLQTPLGIRDLEEARTLMLNWN